MKKFRDTHHYTILIVYLYLLAILIAFVIAQEKSKKEKYTIRVILTCSPF